MAPQYLVGLELRLLDGLQLERLDRRGDVADLVLAAEAGQDQIEVALRHPLDRDRKAADRPCNSATH